MKKNHENVRELSLFCHARRQRRMILSQDRLNLIYDEKKGHSETMGILMRLLFSQLFRRPDAFWKLIENENVPMAVRMIQMLSMAIICREISMRGSCLDWRIYMTIIFQKGRQTGCVLFERKMGKKPGSRTMS